MDKITGYEEKQIIIAQKIDSELANLPKIFYQYVEYRTAFKPRGMYHKINSRLCDRYGMRLFDGVLPISNYLEEKSHEAAPETPTLKIPPICDFELFEKNKTQVKH